MRQIKRNIIIGIILLLLLIMAVGYASFATEFHFKGNAEIISSWDVRITNVEVINATNGTNPGNPNFTNTTVTFNAKLINPGDTITYRVTIENLGTINAKLKNVLFQTDEINGSKAISYETTALSNILKSGDKTSFNITVTYDKDINLEPNDSKTKTITGIIEYVQE